MASRCSNLSHITHVITAFIPLFIIITTLRSLYNYTSKTCEARGHALCDSDVINVANDIPGKSPTFFPLQHYSATLACMNVSMTSHLNDAPQHPQNKINFYMTSLTIILSGHPRKVFVPEAVLRLSVSKPQTRPPPWWHHLNVYFLLRVGEWVWFPKLRVVQVYG